VPGRASWPASTTYFVCRQYRHRAEFEILPRIRPWTLITGQDEEGAVCCNDVLMLTIFLQHFAALMGRIVVYQISVAEDLVGTANQVNMQDLVFM